MRKDSTEKMITDAITNNIPAASSIMGPSPREGNSVNDRRAFSYRSTPEFDMVTNLSDMQQM